MLTRSSYTWKRLISICCLKKLVVIEPVSIYLKNSLIACFPIQCDQKFLLSMDKKKRPKPLVYFFMINERMHFKFRTETMTFFRIEMDFWYAWLNQWMKLLRVPVQKKPGMDDFYLQLFRGKSGD